MAPLRPRDEAFRQTREAAFTNLEVQTAREKVGLVIFLNVLQAITDWGNSVSSEASSLTQYNSGLASLERETGTILDTHGIVFTEERFAAIGPAGRHFEPECYPKSLAPSASFDRYNDSGKASEEAFNLEDFSQKPTEKAKTEKPGQIIDSVPTEPNSELPGASEPAPGRSLFKSILFRRFLD